MKALGWMAPNQIQSGLDEPELRAEKEKLASSMNPKQRERFFPQVETFSKMVENVSTFDQQKQPFSCGQFVYKDVLPGAFAKGTDSKRGEVFIITQIEKGKDIPRYHLINLNKVKQTGTYYAASLHHVPKIAHPSEETSYRIKKIIKHRTINGVKMVLVQWENYNHSFDRWIPETNITSAAVTD